MNKFEKTLDFIKQSITKDSEFYQQIYLVGGCVRDELLGERFTDLDLLINMPDGQKKFVEYMCATYPKQCRGPFYYKRYGTTAMDVYIDDVMTLVECVEPHVETYDETGTILLDTHFCTLEEDSVRRDYTCNALYKNLNSNKVLDPTGMGIKDLRDHFLRTPGDPYEIFRQDPVRMLRGVRFKHQKGFDLDPKAWDSILQLSDLIVGSSENRIREEMHKIIKSKDMAGGILDLYKSGMMKYLLPGLENYMGEDAHANYLREDFSIWRHTSLALDTLIKEHPHADTVSKIAILFMDVALTDGIEAAEKIIEHSFLGKEKISSVIFAIKCYLRYRTFFNGRDYVAKSKVLPRFITSLNGSKAEFRRMVRALNHGMVREAALPYEVLYDGAEMPVSRVQLPYQKSRFYDPQQAEKRHQRNVKKRAKQKAARAARKAAAQQQEADITAETDIML